MQCELIVNLLSEKMKIGVLSLMFEKSGVPMSERIRMTQDPGAQSSPILLVPKPRGRLIVKQGLEVPGR